MYLARTQSPSFYFLKAPSLLYSGVFFIYLTELNGEVISTLDGNTTSE